MPNTIKIHFEGDVSDLKKALNDAVKGIGDSPGGSKPGKGFGLKFSQGFKDAFAGFTVANLVSKGIDKAFDAVSDSIDKMLAKENALADFSALTGVTGEALAKVGKDAENLAMQFGGSSVKQIETMKGLLSKFGPDIANTPVALANMTKNVNLFSKASGLDAVQSMEALTTAMLQYDVSLDNPIQASNVMKEQMDIMSASAKEGASEVPSIADALKEVGLQAKNLNIPFSETNALIQTVALGGKQGAENGRGLRNVLAGLVDVTVESAEWFNKMGLSVDEVKEILTTKGANEALKLLNVGLNKLPTSADRATALIKIFGKENLAVASTVIANTEATDKYNKANQNTNTTLEQANIRMQTTQQKWERFSTFLSETFVKVLEGVKGGLAEVFNVFSEGDFLSFFSSVINVNKQGERILINQAKLRQQGLKDAEEQKKKQAQISKLTKEATDNANKLTGAIKDTKPAKTLDGLREEVSKLNAEFGKTKEGTKRYGELIIKIQSLEKEISKIENKLKPKEKKSIDYTKIEEEQRLKNIENTEDKIESIREKNRQSARERDDEFLKDMNKTGEAIVENRKSLTNAIDDIGRKQAETYVQQINKSTEQAQKIIDDRSQIMFDVLAIVGGGLGAGFGENAKDSWKQTLKALANSTITFVETELLISKAMTFIKAIFTSGASIPWDIAWNVLALTALEGARGYINSLDKGGILQSDQIIQAHKKEVIIPLNKLPDLLDRERKNNVYRKNYFPSESLIRSKVSISYGSQREAIRVDNIKRSKKYI